MSIDLTPFGDTTEGTHMQLRLNAMQSKLEWLTARWRLALFEGDTEAADDVHQARRDLMRRVLDLSLEFDKRAHQNALERLRAQLNNGEG